MASVASAARDIPQGSSRDNLTAVAARSAPVTRSHPLPTPPNSISPALPPHGLKAQLQKAKLEPIDSDLDLHHDTDSQAVGSPAFDATGAPITPALLARDYLPDILLNNGPLAIRYIMGHLTSVLPDFATIPPAKARRLVVGALEGRGSGGEGGGKDGDVVFEKVGWGRWDARKRGQPPRQLSPTAAGAGPEGIPISAKGWPSGRPRLTASSLGGESAAFSHDDHDLNMMDHEAERMSLDGSVSDSPSCSGDEDVDMGDDPEDATDDEDWAALGAATLRAASYQDAKAAGLSPAHPPLSSRVHTLNHGGARSFSATAPSDVARPAQPPTSFDISAAFGRASDAQEREAVEALLRLGSV